MSRFKDITGQKFGRLTALYRLYNTKCRTKWLCVCDCGNFIEVLYDSLTGNCKSCGCLRKENTSKMFRNHGLRHTRLYNIWCDMKARCYNKKVPKYQNYGERGVIVCDEWRNNFMVFYDRSMSNGYKEDLTIDRINVNGNYEPSNCRWVNLKTQERNRTNNKNITIKYETHCLSEWCEILGLRYGTVVQRINVYNWSIERALELEE